MTRFFSLLLLNLLLLSLLCNAADSKKLDRQKPDRQKIHRQKPDRQNTHAQEPDRQKTHAQKAASKKTDSKKTYSQKTDSKKTDSQKKDGQSDRQLIVCQNGKCRKAKDVKNVDFNSKDLQIYHRENSGKLVRANTISIVSQNIVKKCTYQKGGYKCENTKKKENCFTNSKGDSMVCVANNPGHIRVKCWKINGKGIACSHHRVCAYSKKLKGIVCFHPETKPKRLCMKENGQKRCYDLDDLSRIKYALVCRTTKDKKRVCKLIVTAFCVKSGRCYRRKTPGKLAVRDTRKRRMRRCARLIVTQAAAARISMYCRQHPEEVRCKYSVRAEQLGQQAKRQIEAKCPVPKDVVECRRGHIEMTKCHAQVNVCKSMTNEVEKRKCFREIYATCITVIHLTKHFCDKKTLQTKFSASCIAVERQELKCFVMFQHCKRAKTKAEKATCEKEVELRCAYLTFQYIECFYYQHGVKPVAPPKKKQVSSAQHTRACHTLQYLRTKCSHHVMECNRLTGKNRDRCFGDIMKTCVTVFRLYHQHKHECAVVWKAAEKKKKKKKKKKQTTKSVKKPGPKFCTKLRKYTRICLARVKKCNECEGIKKRNCFYKIRDCRKVFVLYNRYKTHCYKSKT